MEIPSAAANIPSSKPFSPKTKVVVATTVMLSFISFWRAAAIVLNDLGSSAFYVGGIAEQAVGKAAPWFVLGVMLFSYLVRAIYVESCTMFTRGGVYKVVKEAMGGTLGKLSVSALMFDYILTGPISGVSAGQYIIGLISQTSVALGHPWVPGKETINLLAAGIAVLIVCYFWWRNIQGIHESSEDALNIMKITTVMVVIMISWSVFTLIVQGPAQIPPPPLPHNLHFSEHAVGWMPNLLPNAFEKVSEAGYNIAQNAGLLFGLLGIFMAFGHSILAMSGEESLAQVNRELEHPKLKNLLKAGGVIFFYSLVFTSLVSIFASFIIPDAVRHNYYDNLISGLTMHFVGPLVLRLIFQAFVVVVGFLMLSGAVNTAIIGSNGVLNRVSEDGVLIDWFRAPHKKYGTTFRLINLVVILQLVTILLSRGNVYLLGEAYAFGVVWSFAMKGLSVLVLRYTDKRKREWKVPGNFTIGKIEIPWGLAIISAALFFIAVVNLFTKEVATISGIGLTLIFFTIFTVSEHLNKKKHGLEHPLEHFALSYADSPSPEALQVRPGNVLVTVRDMNTLEHLDKALHQTDTDEKDIVVMTVRMVAGQEGGSRDVVEESNFSDYEQKLFSQVVSLAEHHGKSVQLLTVPATNIFDAIAQTIPLLDSSVVVAGSSAIMSIEDQARHMGQAWEKVKKKTVQPVQFHIVDPQKGEYLFSLGAHAPELMPEDVEMIHKIWLNVTRHQVWRNVRHRDVVHVALHRLNRDLHGESGVLGDFIRTLQPPAKPPTDKH